MKRCPECRRDYPDETLNFCLDDGTPLVGGSSFSDAPTAVFGPDNAAAKEVWSPRPRKTGLLLALGLLLVGGGGFWLASGGFTEKAGLSRAAPDSYTRAKVLIGSENRESLDAAIKLLEQAVSEDPKFAAGWAQLGRAYSKKAFYFAAADNERKQLNEDAEFAVEKSISIDPDLAEGHLGRGLILWTHSKRFPHEQAVQSHKRAIALDPNLDEAHHQLGLIYFHLGLYEKALAEIRKALEINPGNSLARFRYGVIDLYRGRYEDAYTFFKSTPLEQTPSLQAFQTATVLFKLGRIDEASAMIDRYLREYPNDEGGVGTSVRAMILAKNGQTGDAEAAIKRAEEIGRDFGHFHHTAYNIASAYALLGRPAQAVDYLQMAADDGFPCYPLFESDEVFTGMRQYPRYVELLARLKVQWERYNATL